MNSILSRLLLRECAPFYQSVRLGSVQVVVFKPKDHNQRLKEEENLKCGRKYALIKMEQLLGVRKFTALDLVMKNKRLWDVPGVTMDDNYKICKKEAIKKVTCIKFPELLAQSDLSTKIEILKNVPTDINEVAPLAVLPMNELIRFIGTDEKITAVMLRVKEMCRLLKTKQDVIFEAFTRRPFLKYINMDRLMKSVKLLTENGVTTEEIIKDWWVLQYNPHTIQLRIDLAREGNIEKIKTWMVRGQLDIFESYVKRRSENKEILGDNTLAEYLSVRLDCTVDAAKGLITRMPALKKKNIKKLREIIDLLYSEGFKPHHICRVPKILIHSVETTRKRIRELELQGMQMDSLHMLTKSKKQYMQYYEALVKSNKSKIKNLTC